MRPAAASAPGSPGACPLDDPDCLRLLLLDLVSTEREVRPRVAALDGGAWDALLACAAEHRVKPLLHWRLTHERSGLPVPADVLSRLAAAYVQATLRAVRVQRELVLTVRRLRAARIPCVALKGAYLAFHAYPAPALRPHRDLDLLVPAADVRSAFDALLDAGFARTPTWSGDAATWATRFPHLPVLRSPGGVPVELHHSLEMPGGRHLGDWESGGLWDRLIEAPVAGEPVSYLSPADALLHVVVHALYQHRLENGPLTLTDIAVLTRTGSVDWELFWRLAEEGGLTRASRLLFTLTESCLGPLPVEGAVALPQDAVSLVPLCAGLIMRGQRSVADERLAGSLAGRRARGKATLLLEKALPPRAHLAIAYDVDPASAHAFLFYVPFWARLAGKRLPEVLSRRRAAARTARQIAELDDWLARE